MKNLRYLIPLFSIVVIAAAWYLRPETLSVAPGQLEKNLPGVSAPASPSGLLSTEIPQAARALPRPPAGGLSESADPGSVGSVSRDAIEQFVQASARSAASLLAAWSESHDNMWLREAAGKFPDDPAVAFLVLMARLYPEQRGDWLQRLRASSRENCLPELLDASDELRAGRREAAFAVLGAIRTRYSHPMFDDYSLALFQAREALMLASFRDPLEAEKRAMAGLPIESISLVFQLADDLLAEQKAALERNDPDAAHNAARFALQIGQVVNPDGAPTLLLHQLAGISIEQRALIALIGHPGIEAALGFNPEQRLAQLQTQRDEIKTLSALLAPAHLPDGPVLTEYFQHVKTEGELAALRWLAGQQGK